MQVRTKTAAEVAEEEELLKKEAEKMASQGDGGEEDAFLQDFVGNRRWLDPHSKETPRLEKLYAYLAGIRFTPCPVCPRVHSAFRNPYVFHHAACATHPKIARS